MFLNSTIVKLAVIGLSWSLASNISAQHLPLAKPEDVGMRSDHLSHIDAIVAQGISQQKMPGCVIAAGRRGKLVFLKAYGNRQLSPEQKPMTIDTVFDMASITKPVATATSVMALWERGKIRFRDRVSTHIPEFAVNGKKNITIQQLLTHQAGLIPDNALADYNDGTKKAFERIYDLTTYVDPGSKFVYTDVGFILLADLIERLGGMNVHEFSQANIFRPLGMSETGYLPNESLRARCAVTEQRNDKWMQGEVHDPRAYRMDGIAGHAGLFSTAQDIAIYAQMMLNGGTYRGKRILNQRTVEIMTAAYPVSSGTRGLGWDKQTGYSSNRGENLTELAFGHGGFTGTVLWIDPGLDLFYIFLSNRVHPNGKGSVNHLAGRIGTVIAASIDDQGQRGNTNEDTKIDSHGNATVEPQQGTPGGHVESNVSQSVKTGLDVLIGQRFKLLHGKRVGLITNHTGVDADGHWSVPQFHAAPEVKLAALFSPEHGIAGKLDIAKINDSKDSDTGLKIFSLYGKSRKPSREQLDQIDCLVFDIQDIGTRFYTYISTMGLAMQAAGEHGKQFIVLDRPNPISGRVISGPMLDEDKKSFVGFHSLPIRHGMTVGELARMFKDELQLNVDLQVVAVEGWQRHQMYDETGLMWINPSPNMRNLNQAVLYPGIGLLETTNLSVGRGTDTPFELIGAPWLNAKAICRRLNDARLPGVRFVPTAFTPTSSVFKGEKCQGISILITDRSQLKSVGLGLEIARILHELYPDTWEVERYNRLLGNDAVLNAIREGKSVEQIEQMTHAGLESFRNRRARFLIY